MIEIIKRNAQIARTTNETDIALAFAVDGSGESKQDSGVPFLDHMLDLFARHGHFDLTVKAKGDIEIDYHHTVEDIGICLGQALREALGDKKGDQALRQRLCPDGRRFGAGGHRYQQPSPSGIPGCISVSCRGAIPDGASA